MLYERLHFFQIEAFLRIHIKKNNMKKSAVFLIFILGTLFMTSCHYDFLLPEFTPEVPAGSGGTTVVSFKTQIAPIFADKCISCHDSQSPVLTADLAYSKIVPGYVNVTNPASSKIYSFASSGNHYAKVSSAQAALILAWIKDGAKDN
jgi:hypothetical protein